MKTFFILSLLLSLTFFGCQKTSPERIFFEENCPEGKKMEVLRPHVCSGWLMKNVWGKQFRVFGLAQYEFQEGDIVYLEYVHLDEFIDCLMSYPPEEVGEPVNAQCTN